MVMVAHRDGEQHSDAEPLGGDTEAVNERIVGLAVGSHQELPLRAATRDHVRAPRKNLARNRHVCFSAWPVAQLREINLGAVMAVKSTSVR